VKLPGHLAHMTLKNLSQIFLCHLIELGILHSSPPQLQSQAFGQISGKNPRRLQVLKPGKAGLNLFRAVSGYPGDLLCFAGEKSIVIQTAGQVPKQLPLPWVIRSAWQLLQNHALQGSLFPGPHVSPPVLLVIPLTVIRLLAGCTAGLIKFLQVFHGLPLPVRGGLQKGIFQIFRLHQRIQLLIGTCQKLQRLKLSAGEFLRLFQDQAALHKSVSLFIVLSTIVPFVSLYVRMAQLPYIPSGSFLSFYHEYLCEASRQSISSFHYTKRTHIL